MNRGIQGWKIVTLQVESGQLYHVTTPSFGSHLNLTGISEKAYNSKSRAKGKFSETVSVGDTASYPSYAVCTQSDTPLARILLASYQTAGHLKFKCSRRRNSPLRAAHTQILKNTTVPPPPNTFGLACWWDSLPFWKLLFKVEWTFWMWVSAPFSAICW